MSDSTSTEHAVHSDRHQASQPPTTTSRDTDDGKIERFQFAFGYMRFRPACLHFLSGARWFLLFLCLATFCRTIANGLVGATVSTLERRFALSSSQTAWIAAAYDVVGVLALVVGYFGSKLRRPLWIGAGMFLFGIAVGIYTIPHFVAPAYRYEDSVDSGNLCVDLSGQMSGSRINSSITSSRCSNDEVIDGCKYLAIFIVSMLIQGLGALPLYVLGVTVLSDASPSGTASFHIGMLYLYIWQINVFIFTDVVDVGLLTFIPP